MLLRLQPVAADRAVYGANCSLTADWALLHTAATRTCRLDAAGHGFAACRLALMVAPCRRRTVNHGRTSHCLPDHRWRRCCSRNAWRGGHRRRYRRLHDCRSPFRDSVVRASRKSWQFAAGGAAAAAGVRGALRGGRGAGTGPLGARHQRCHAVRTSLSKGSSFQCHRVPGDSFQSLVRKAAGLSARAAAVHQQRISEKLFNVASLVCLR